MIRPVIVLVVALAFCAECVSSLSLAGQAVGAQSVDDSQYPDDGSLLEARDLLNQVIDAMSGIPPIRVDFEIRGEMDVEMARKTLEVLQDKYSSQGKSVVAVDTNSPLHGVWVYSGESESLTSLPDAHRKDLYLAIPGGTLHQVTKGKYNIDASKNGGPVRPLHFYFEAAGRPSRDLRTASRVEFFEGVLSDDVGDTHTSMRVLEIKMSPSDIRRIHVQLEPLRVRRFETFYNGDRVSEVVVDSFVSDDVDPARHFPARAYRVVYGSGREVRRDMLTCRHVDFLEESAFGPRALDVVVPVGAEVYDTLLERSLQLTAPTSGLDLLTKTGSTARGDRWRGVQGDQSVERDLADIDRGRSRDTLIRCLYVVINVGVVVWLLMLLRRRYSN